MKQPELDEARLNHAAGVLHREIARLCTGMPMNKHTVDKIAEWITVHRTDCKRMGIDFPEMLVIAFPRLGAIEICRRDWSQTDIEVFIVGLPKKYPMITAPEIADGVRMAWPHYKARAASIAAIAPGIARLQ